MSALAAVVMQDGRRADRRRLHDMLQAMSRRGPDGLSLVTDGPIGLGHGLLDTSGEATFLDTERVCVALDGFLADRDGLAASLDLTGAVSDAELVLRAYERWGDNFTKALLGEFVVAVWDKPARTLRVVRDHFGAKPLFYSQYGSATCIASDQGALLAAGAPGQADAKAVVNFLAGLPSAPADTNFQHIKTLPAGHLLSIDARGLLEVRRYWSLELPRPAPRADAPGELRHLLDLALRDRTPARRAPAYALSGGLDSSSLACLARLRRTPQGDPLHAFSMTYGGAPEGDEREFIDAVLGQGGFTAHSVECGDIAPFGASADFIAQHSGPPIGPNTVAAHHLYAAIASEGFRVMIGGHGGDEAISYGNGRMLELAESGRYLALWSEMRSLAQTQGFAAWPAYGRFVRHSIRRFASVRLGGGGSRPARRGSDPGGTIGLLRNEIIDQFDLKTPPTFTERRIDGANIETAQHYLALTNPLQAKAFELIDQSAAANSLEVRHPFWDKRVVEFCLSLPSDEKLRRGVNRRVLRKAMTGIAPDEVVNRHNKFDFTDQIVAPLLRHHEELILDRLYRRADLIEPYVQIDRLRAAFERLAAGRHAGYDFQWVWRSVWASLWLEQLQASNSWPAKVA